MFGIICTNWWADSCRELWTKLCIFLVFPSFSLSVLFRLSWRHQREHITLSACPLRFLRTYLVSETCGLALAAVKSSGQELSRMFSTLLFFSPSRWATGGGPLRLSITSTTLYHSRCFYFKFSGFVFSLLMGAGVGVAVSLVSRLVVNS